MINTIFYFTDTELEYLDNYAQGSVKPHTICFAKDTKSIWRDGQRFSGLRKDEVDLIIDEDVKPLIDALEAALNLANQLAIDRDNQLTEDLHDLQNTVAAVDGRITTEKNRLDAEISRIDGDIADTNQRLLVEHLALIDTADDIQGKLDRGEVAYNSGWNENVKAYMQTVGLWDYGESSSIVTKWSQLRQSVDNVSSEVNLVRLTESNHYTTLDSKINQTAESITSEVNRVETKADGYNTALQSKINQEVTDRGVAITNLSNTFANTTGDLQDVIEWMYSGLHSGAAQDMSYAEIIAAGKNGASSAISDLRTSIETTSDGKYVAQISLTSSVDNAISGIVNAAAGTYANTQLFAKIDENGSKIASLTADVTDLDLSIQGIASNPNLTATFLAKTDFNTAKAALEAADTQNANAIGQVQTQVTRLDGGPEVANSVAAKVDSAISTFEQKVNNGQACTVLVNKVDATSEDLVALTEYIDPDQAYATIGAKIAASEAGVITLVKDDLATAGILTKNGNDYTSAVYTKTQTDGAISSATAGLMAANDFTSASVVAKVNDAGSGIAINADKIKIDANHQLDLTAQTITVNADDINLVGQTHFESAIGEMIEAQTLTIGDVDEEVTSILENGDAAFSGDVYAKTLTAGDISSLGLNIYTTGSTILFRKGSDNRAYFTSNGSGLQLYVKNESGNWYCIDFTNWKAVSGGDYQTINCYTYQTGSDSTHKVTLVPEKYYYDQTTGLYYTSPNSSGAIPAGTTITTYELSFLSDYYLYNVVSLVYGPNQQYDVADPIGIGIPVECLRKIQITRTSKTYTDEYIFLASPFMARLMRCDGGDPTVDEIYPREYTSGHEFVKVGTSDKTVRFAENPEEASYAVRVNDVTIPANHIVVPADSNYPTVYNGIPFGTGPVSGMPTN